MLGDIQDALGALYDLEAEHGVEDYLCSAEVVQHTVGDATLARREALLVMEEDGDLHVGVYLEKDLLGELKGSLAEAFSRVEHEAFSALCLAVEGVSHFVYLLFRADNADSVTQLELELQAEVDKYAAALLSADSQDRLGLSRSLRARLFEGARFVDGADCPVGQRYRHAHRAAARYARHLEREFVAAGRSNLLMRTELRRFYRMGQGGKLRHIRRLG